MSADQSKEPTMRATMWAEMKPDIYGGKNCDEIEPRWHCYGEGDKDADYIHEPLELDAKVFPPGTKITVKEPECPKCGELRAPNVGQDRPLFDAKCECGFDWDEWTRNTYA